MRIAGSLWSVPTTDQLHTLSSAISDGLAVVHWDATDGVFAAPGGFTPATAMALLAQAPAVESEAHLMMHDPLSAIPLWAEFCTAIAVPIEIENAFKAIDVIVAHGVQPRLAISPQTDLTRLPADIPVLLMSVQPGQAGSRFQASTIDRAARLHELDPERMLGADGGITPTHCADLTQAGVRWIVSGTSLFTAPSPRQWLEQCQLAAATADRLEADTKADWAVDHRGE